MSDQPIRVVGDLGALPRSATGPAHLVWWGNFGFMLIEGMAFVLAAGCYFYLIGRNPTWPPPGDAMPDFFWGTIFTLILLASEVPNLVLLRMSKREDAKWVRWLALLMVAIGVTLAVVRAMEFAHLNIVWDHDAYGSVVWMLMVLHTTHIITELGETGVQTVWLFTHEIGEDQFADVEDDSNYWTFVVLAWLPIYGMIYWLPRLL
jgi:heme/copper-type cytochrome/quinol oxidase subunit 3